MTMEIKVWCQMFFDDGSVSEGKRFSAEILDDKDKNMKQIAHDFLKELGREEGFMLTWGAGNLIPMYYKVISSKESDSSASAP